MRIIHFSDIHMGGLTHDPTALFDKRLLGMVNYYLRRHRHLHPEYVERAISRILALAPDLVICSGDITCIGSREEFAMARRRLAPLVRNTSFRFVYIPGNHDHYVPRHRCHRELHDTFAFLNNNRFGLPDLPLEIERPGLRLFLLNECGPTSPLSSAGHLPQDSAVKLEAWLREPRKPGEKRLIVGHYPLRQADNRQLSWRRRLYGAEPLETALAQGTVDILLCGHIHQPFIRNLPNAAMEICAGSLTLAGKLNVLDYSPATGRFRQFWEDVSGHGPSPVPSGAILSEGAPSLKPAGAGQASLMNSRQGREAHPGHTP